MTQFKFFRPKNGAVPTSAVRPIFGCQLLTFQTRRLQAGTLVESDRNRFSVDCQKQRPSNVSRASSHINPASNSGQGNRFEGFMTIIPPRPPLCNFSQLFLVQSSSTCQDGHIDFKEFMIVLYVMSNGTPEENLRQIFRVFDINNDGRISVTELRRIVKVESFQQVFLMPWCLLIRICSLSSMRREMLMVLVRMPWSSQVHSCTAIQHSCTAR